MGLNVPMISLLQDMLKIHFYQILNLKRVIHCKKKQPKNIFVKNIKSRMNKNGKPNYHAYQYRYTNKKNIKTTFRPNGDNKVYHMGPNGWSYGIENKKVFFFRKLINQKLHPNRQKSSNTHDFKRKNNLIQVSQGSRANLTFQVSFCARRMSYSNKNIL
jgi:hypothetical protein